MIAAVHRALLLVVSAPSGAGKTTLCHRLMTEFPSIRYSISCTTRAPRAGERDGHDYHFLSERDFEVRRAAGEFLEYACVHDHWYGTLRQPVREALAAGGDVIMDIDVQGAATLRAGIRERLDDPLHDAYVDVFIAPPSLDSLRDRLQARGQDAPDVIARRLKNAENEMARWREYRYLVVNDQLDAAYDQLRAIVLAERCRVF